MQFNLPTTKSEMYTILNDLFYYYRIRREGFEEINLQELQLERLSIEEVSDENLMQLATKLLSAKHQREILEYQDKVKSEIAEIEQKIILLEKNLVDEIENVHKLYDESIAKIESQALKNGLVNSSIVVDKTASLLNSKNQKIAEITQAKNDDIASLTAKKNTLDLMLKESQDFFNSVHQKEKEIKFEELLQEKEKQRIEVFKYNNSLDEKEQRYANTLKESKASLELRFLDISSGEFTKDKLIEMGYYEDVIRCVCGYYNTLSASNAYADFSSESKLAIYLDDYYQEILYLYKTRLG